MEPNVSRFGRRSLGGRRGGVRISLSVIAGLVAVTFYAGLYYSIPE